MQTTFTAEQLSDPEVRSSAGILRRCVHCGFCTATCPTYVLLGDELDSPRGRIYLIKDMLENSKPASAEVVKHIDRCLSCLACMTTCPSDVHYMHLVDHARKHIEQTYRRPAARTAAARACWRPSLPRPSLFRFSLLGAWLARPLARFLPGRLRTLFELAPARIPAPSPVDRPQVFPAEGPRRGTGRAAERLRPAGPGARDQRDDDPAPDPARRRGRGRARVPAAAARSPTTWARSGRHCALPGRTSTPGGASSRARAWMPW